MERRELNDQVNGLNYKDHTYMVGGWISDYKLTYEKMEDGSKTVNDFKENRGYVNDEGYVYIFREHPDRRELIPWFTVVMNDNGTPSLKYSTYRNEELRKMFRIERVGDLSLKAIENNSDPNEMLYDEEVLNDIMNATSTYIPEINPGDDFLKRIVKTVIIEKGVNVNKYKKMMNHSYELSNLLQGLAGTTKTSPIVFGTWMELLNCDFEIRIRDRGEDTADPLKYDVVYESRKNEVIIDGKDKSSGPKSAIQ